MSATVDGRNLAELSIDDVISAQKRATTLQNQAQPSPHSSIHHHSSRTLLDIIKDEGSYKGLLGNKEKKSWKIFRNKLRLKRTSSSSKSSTCVPTSDIVISNNNTNQSQPNRQYTMTLPNDSRPQMVRAGSTRLGPTQSFRSDPNDRENNSPKVRTQLGRRQSIRLAPEEDATDPPRSDSSRRLSAAITDERSMSARDAVAAQEAAEAKAAAAAAAQEEEEEEDDEGRNGGEPVTMSLMDLLEETDRQMGVVGSRYRMGDDDDEEDFEDEEEEEEESISEVEHTCCVCMVRHKGTAFVPCGHTFCRLCSRELWVSKGNCPLCNNFILEILDIF